MKRFIIYTLMSLLCGLGNVMPALASSGAGAIVLQFPIGARYNALGESGSAIAQDATASWFNPGGLAFLAERRRNNDVQLMYSPLVPDLADDISLTWLGYAAPMGGGVLGFSLTYLDMGEQMGTDPAGNPTDNFKSFAYVVQGNFGFKVSPYFGLGFGVKYFRDRLAPDHLTGSGAGGSGDSFGIDVGVLWKAPTLNLNLGASVMNLGPRIMHDDEDQADPMPRRFSLGAAYGLYHSEFMGLLVVSDYLIPLYKYSEDADDYTFGLDLDQREWGAGIEWNYDRSLFVRFGYKIADYGDIRDTTFGFGVDLGKWMNQAIIFDFASVPQAKGLERVSRFTLGYSW